MVSVSAVTAFLEHETEKTSAKMTTISVKIIVNEFRMYVPFFRVIGLRLS
jgi:hypothetical protein